MLRSILSQVGGTKASGRRIWLRRAKTPRVGFIQRKPLAAIELRGWRGAGDIALVQDLLPADFLAQGRMGGVLHALSLQTAVKT